MKVIVGNAWPYANGSLHIGRVSSWIPGDVIARYHRAKGDEVIFISGADCHGAPILNKAKEMNKSPKAVSSYFHREFKRNFEAMKFSFDIFTKTDSEFHGDKVKEFILQLNDNGFIYSKEVEEYFCPKCNEVIGDRSIKGLCPHCHEETTGELCNNCSKSIEPEQLKNKKCIVCNEEPIFRKSEQLFFKLSAFEKYIENLVEQDLGWRENAKKLTRKYVKEGLRDRTLSRDIDWGIDIPIEGFEDKKVYVWIDAIMSYLTASFQYIEDEEMINEYWNNKENRIYLVHGKENIPFHSIILPSILNGLGFKDANLRIISSEYMNLEGKKFSSNRNWVVWLSDILNSYDESSIRYYLLKNGPEQRIANFSWKEFINLNNNELLGIYGNFINRIVVFINKYYGGKFEFTNISTNISKLVEDTYKVVGKNIELGNMNLALREIVNLINESNEYFDQEKPWLIQKNDPSRCNLVIGSCLYVAVNLGNLLNPFIPGTGEKIRTIFNFKEISWEPIRLEFVSCNEKIFLFNRIAPVNIKEEVKKLKYRKR